jgi:hypothetical protein
MVLSLCLIIAPDDVRKEWEWQGFGRSSVGGEL